MHWTGHFAIKFRYTDTLSAKSSLIQLTDIQLSIMVVIGAIIVCFVMVTIVAAINSSRRELEQIVCNLEQEKNVSEQLLLNILPSVIATRMKNGEENIHQLYDNVTVLFSDIVSFTKISQNAPPQTIVLMLHKLFTLFDEALEYYQLEKIKTIGDAYMCVGGIPLTRKDHASATVKFGIEMIRIVDRFNDTYFGSDGEESGGEMSRLSIRVGCHSGSVVAGIVGTNKFLFDIFGSTVNIASRMESTGIPMNVQISEETFQLIKDDFLCEQRQDVSVKGVGVQTTYIVIKDITPDCS
jgi:adenylate cyclase